MCIRDSDQPLHLGITESGSYRAGSVKSSIGLGMLLSEGIGDTIRVSLASDPVDEVKIGWDILKSLNLRSRGIRIVACPSCSRQNFNVIEVVNELETRFEGISEDLEVAIIGCYVNGAPSKKISNEKLVDTIEEQVKEQLEKKNSLDIIAKG